MAVVSSKLTPNSGSYVVEAKHVAFTEGTGAVTLQSKLEALISAVNALSNADPEDAPTASTLIYEGTQTIKQKIDSLASSLGTSADNISYSYTQTTDGEEETVTTTVKAVLDSLRSALGGITNIDLKVAQAAASASAAAASASSAQTYQSTITATLNDKLSEITEINNATQNAKQEVVTKIDTLSSIASQLSTIFDVDASFQVLPLSEYNNLQEVEANRIYFCYNDPASSDTMYTVTLLSTDTTKGTVVGAGAYASGTQVTIVGLPKNGFNFVKWSDENTDNPRVITVSANTTLTATFAAPSTE